MNKENIGKRISTGLMEMETEDSENCAMKLADKRKYKKLTKRTNEIIEIEATLLTCLSSELGTNFEKCVNKIIEAKFAEGSLVCYQIVINSIVALHSKQYPSYSEQAIQEMTNSLLQKIFQKMALENYECAIDCDENDLTKKRCHSELLCLLEMYLLRFTSSIASTSSKIHQDTRKSLATNIPSTSSSSSSASRMINFTMEPKKQQLQMNNNFRPFRAYFESIKPTRLATKNIVARLRHLYLLCTDPEEFHHFVEDILCDEFIEELPLVSIYEQLGIEIPSELEPYNQQKNGRQFRRVLGCCKNKCRDKSPEPIFTDLEGNEWKFLAPSGYFEAHYPLCGMLKYPEILNSDVSIFHCAHRFDDQKCPHLWLLLKKEQLIYQRFEHSHTVDVTPIDLLKGKTPSPKKTGPDADLATKMDYSGWKCDKQGLMNQEELANMMKEEGMKRAKDDDQMRIFYCKIRQCGFKFRWLKRRAELWSIGEHNRHPDPASGTQPAKKKRKVMEKEGN